MGTGRYRKSIPPFFDLKARPSSCFDGTYRTCPAYVVRRDRT